MTEVLFISGHGREYIQTDIHLDNECIVKSRWMFNNDSACIYGSFTSGRTDNFCLYGGSHSSDSYIRFNGQLVRAFRPVSGTTYSFEHGADGFFVDGTKIASFSAVTFTCSVPLRIFGLPNSNYGPISGSCYGFQILKKKPASELLPEETVVLYDFVPVKNEDTGEAGMYETVNGVFYGNASGKGAFTASTTIIERPIAGKISAFRRRLMEAACEHYEPEPGWDGYIWCYYNVTDISQPTTIFGNTVYVVGDMIVDGVPVTPSTSYQFNSIGEHLVKFKKSRDANYRWNGATALTRCYGPVEYTTWDYAAFIGCTNLKFFKSAGLTTLTSVVFNGTTSLEVVELDAITTITNQWINKGNNVTVKLGPNISSLPAPNKFIPGTYVKTVVIMATTPPSFADGSFGSLNENFRIFVPYTADHSVLLAYKNSAGFNTVAQYIYELNPDGTIPV